MKRLLPIMLTLFLLASCTNSFTVDNKPKFSQLDNQDKWYPVFDSITGAPVMVADSQWLSTFENGKLKTSVKVGKPGTERQATRMGKDSICDVGPSTTTVRRLLNMNPLKEVKIIYGILCLVIMLGIWVWAYIKKLTIAKVAIWLMIIPSFVLFYMGMQALQKDTFNISKSNTKQISMPTYRHYFMEDPEGTYFWDSINGRGGIVDKHWKK